MSLTVDTNTKQNSSCLTELSAICTHPATLCLITALPQTSTVSRYLTSFMSDKISFLPKATEYYRDRVVSDRIGCLRDQEPACYARYHSKESIKEPRRH